MRGLVIGDKPTKTNPKMARIESDTFSVLHSHNSLFAAQNTAGTMTKRCRSLISTSECHASTPHDTTSYATKIQLNYQKQTAQAIMDDETRTLRNSRRRSVISKPQRRASLVLGLLLLVLVRPFTATALITVNTAARGGALSAPANGNHTNPSVTWSSGSRAVSPKKGKKKKKRRNKQALDAHLETRDAANNKSCPGKRRNASKPAATRTAAPAAGASKAPSFSTKTTTTTNTPLSREAATSLRRIQGEWKDAVQAGIAYDWKNSKAVRRKSAHVEPQHAQHVWLGPLTSNIWIWHFTVTGVPGSVFGDGIYHGRVVLPSNYPAQPPRIQVWTQSGRFVPRADICLSASSYHPESWTASWSIRTLVEALRLHMLTAAQEIGGISESYEQRLTKAAASRSWRCRISPTIVVDHAHMVEQGLFPPVEKKVEAKGEDTVATDDESAAERRETSEWTPRGRSAQNGLATTIPVRSKAEHTLPAKPSLLTTLKSILASPIRLTLLGVAILFLMLNKP